MARTQAPTTDVLTIAHRGSSGVAPENTLAAVRAARLHGADTVENDIQRTRDGELVVLHDRDLARTTDVRDRFPDRAPWHVGDFTLAEIRSLDAGSWFDARFAGEQVPTLRQWARAVGERAGMLLEVKRPVLYPGIEQDLVAELDSVPALQRAVREERVVVQCFDHAWLARFKTLAPRVPVGLLYGAVPTLAQIRSASTWAEQVNPSLSVTTRRLVRSAHALGLKVNVWTVNGPDGMRRAIRIGVDGIITNHPDVLGEVRGDHARRSGATVAVG